MDGDADSDAAESLPSPLTAAVSFSREVITPQNPSVRAMEMEEIISSTSAQLRALPCMLDLRSCQAWRLVVALGF